MVAIPHQCRVRVELFIYLQEQVRESFIVAILLLAAVIRPSLWSRTQLPANGELRKIDRAGNRGGINIDFEQLFSVIPLSYGSVQNVRNPVCLAMSFD